LWNEVTIGKMASYSMRAATGGENSTAETEIAAAKEQQLGPVERVPQPQASDPGAREREEGAATTLHAQ